LVEVLGTADIVMSQGWGEPGWSGDKGTKSSEFFKIDFKL
jgi:hypothetical protein